MPLLRSCCGCCRAAYAPRFIQMVLSKAGSVQWKPRLLEAPKQCCKGGAQLNPLNPPNRPQQLNTRLQVRVGVWLQGLLLALHVLLAAAGGGRRPCGEPDALCTLGCERGWCKQARPAVVFAVGDPAFMGSSASAAGGHGDDSWCRVWCTKMCG